MLIDERALRRAARVVVVTALAVFALYLVRGVLLPLLFVAVVVFVGLPGVVRLERRGIPRAVAAALVLGGFGLVLVFLALLVVPPLFSDLRTLVARAPDVLREGVRFLEQRTGVSVPMSWGELSQAASADLLQQLSPVAAKGGAVLGAGAAGLAQGAMSALGFVGTAALVPVLSFFVLAEWPEVRGLLARVAPLSWRTGGARYLPLIHEALSGLVRGQVTVAALMAVIYAVGLSLAGVPLAIGISILAGAAYLIPFASASTALVLAVAFSLLELGLTGAVGPSIGAAVTCVLVQIVEGYVLTPRIVGEKAGLSPLATLLAVLCGGSAAGFLGVLFALPVGAVIALLVRERTLTASTASTASTAEVTA